MVGLASPQTWTVLSHQWTWVATRAWQTIGVLEWPSSCLTRFCTSSSLHSGIWFFSWAFCWSSSFFVAQHLLWLWRSLSKCEADTRSILDRNSSKLVGISINGMITGMLNYGILECICKDPSYVCGCLIPTCRENRNPAGIGVMETKPENELGCHLAWNRIKSSKEV